MSSINTLSNSYKHGVPLDALYALELQKMAHKWPKTTFYLVFSYSTVTTSILTLQNVSYHHTEQLLQIWSPHRCLIGLRIAKIGQKMA